MLFKATFTANRGQTSFPNPTLKAVPVMNVGSSVSESESWKVSLVSCLLTSL